MDTRVLCQDCKDEITDAMLSRRYSKDTESADTVRQLVSERRWDEAKNVWSASVHPNRIPE